MANLPGASHEVPANVLAVVNDILEAFNCACDFGEVAVAKRLLDTVEMILAKRVAGKKRSDFNQVNPLSDAYQRLLHLQREIGSPR